MTIIGYYSEASLNGPSQMRSGQPPSNGHKQKHQLILARYVQTPILATLVSSKFANFGNQRLPNLATDDTCQFWQLLCPQNLPILVTDNICQFGK